MHEEIHLALKTALKWDFRYVHTFKWPKKQMWVFGQAQKLKPKVYIDYFYGYMYSQTHSLINHKPNTYKLSSLFSFMID